MALPSCFRCFDLICTCNIHPGRTNRVSGLPLLTAEEMGTLEECLGSLLTHNHQHQPKTQEEALGSTARLIIRNPARTDETFVNKCFPHDYQQAMRDRLLVLLQQYWLLFNAPEPPGSLSFLLFDIGARQQQCAICSRVYRRGTRALEHIRVHLSHRPFRCDGGFSGCSNFTCGKTFHSQEAMKDHQRRGKVQCERCHTIVLRKNYIRHLKAQVCSQA